MRRVDVKCFSIGTNMMLKCVSIDTDMIGLSRAGPVWNEKGSGTQGWREKILVSFRYRFVLRLSGLVEEVIGKLSEKIWIKNI